MVLSKKYGGDSGPNPAAFSARMVTLYLLSGLISVRFTIGFSVESNTGIVVGLTQASLMEAVMEIQ